MFERLGRAKPARRRVSLEADRNRHHDRSLVGRTVVRFLSSSGRLRRARQISTSLPPRCPRISTMFSLRSMFTRSWELYSSDGIGRGEAEASYRRAIDLAGTLIERVEQPDASDDRPGRRARGARISGARPRPARRSGDAAGGAVADLRSLKGSRNVGPLLSERFESLAQGFRKLGERDRAETVAGWARAVGRRPPRRPSDGLGPPSARPARGGAHCKRRAWPGGRQKARPSVAGRRPRVPPCRVIGIFGV